MLYYTLPIDTPQNMTFKYISEKVKFYINFTYKRIVMLCNVNDNNNWKDNIQVYSDSKCHEPVFVVGDLDVNVYLLLVQNTQSLIKSINWKIIAQSLAWTFHTLSIIILSSYHELNIIKYNMILIFFLNTHICRAVTAINIKINNIIT